MVEDAYKVFITLYDGTTNEGEVIGRDQENDLAIVKFEEYLNANNLKSLIMEFSSIFKITHDLTADDFGW